MYRVSTQVILFGLLICLLPFVSWAGEKDSIRAYQQLWTQGRKVAACEALGDGNTIRVALKLVQILFQQLVEPKNEKPAELVERQKVINACTTGFSKFTDDKSLKYFSGIASKRNLSPSQKSPFIRAFGKMRNAAGAKMLLELRGKVRQAESKIQIAEAMDDNKNPLLIDTWLKDLSSPYWIVQVYAIKSLARQKTKKAMVPLMGLLKHEHPKVSYWAHEALVGMTGTDNGKDEADWSVWWKKEKDKPLAGGGLGTKPKTTRRGSVTFRTPTYYGQKFRSKHVAFVIDISGSMGALVKGDLKQPKKSPLDKRPASLRYDWSRIRDRLDLAKAHLVYTLAHLDQRTHFNIFIYSSNNKTWKENGWVPGTQSNKIMAIERVKKLAAGGGTNIYEALERAFNFPGKKPLGSLDKSIKKGVDTIFLMTDGIPTSGTVTQSSHKDYRERFVVAVRKWNKGRKIVVHTVGVGSRHDGRLLSMIAKSTGGNYTKVGTE